MKTAIFAITATALVGAGLFMGVQNASAYKGDPSVKGPNYNPERHEQMEKAFENNDYNSWKNLMEESNKGKRVLEVINQSNFTKFAQVHELMEQGKIDEANKIRTELGLGMKNGSGQNGGMRGYGQGKGNCVNQ